MAKVIKMFESAIPEKESPVLIRMREVNKARAVKTIAQYKAKVKAEQEARKKLNMYK